MTTFPALQTYFFDNATWTATGVAPNDYFTKNSFARMKIQTNSQFNGVLSVSGVPNGPTYQFDNCVSCWVDGAFNQLIPFDYRRKTLAQTVDVRGLPLGAHLIELEETSSANMNITAVTLDNGAPLTVTGTSVKNLIILGDSLSCCINAGVYDPTTKFEGRSLGWAMRLRRGSRFDSVKLLGKAGDFASNQMGNGSQITATVAKVVAAYDGSAENVFLYELGTNDYIGGTWTHTAYQTGLGNFLDAVHTALRSLRMLACTTSILSGVGANSVGSTKAQYDAATLAAAAARSSYCTGIDLTATVTLSMLNEGDGFIHYGNSGHAAVYTQILSVA